MGGAAAGASAFTGSVGGAGVAAAGGAGVGGVGEGVTAVGLAAMASSPASTLEPPQPIGQSGGDAPRGTWIRLTNFLWFRAEFRLSFASLVCNGSTVPYPRSYI